MNIIKEIRLNSIYLIKYGRSQTTNAQYLLKMVGITKEV